MSLLGLNPKEKYTISVRAAATDNLRYKYMNTKWCTVGESDVVHNEERQIYHHPSSPATGEVWMKKPLSFKAIKITSHIKSKHGNVSQTKLLAYCVAIL